MDHSRASRRRRHRSSQSEKSDACHSATSITPARWGLLVAYNISILDGKTSKFRIPGSCADYYSPAIYGFLGVNDQLFATTVHLDADAVILGEIDGLANLVTRGSPELAATTDYPPLDLNFQVGNDPDTHRFVSTILPSFEPSSVSFNGGVFAISRDYYLKHMLPHIEALAHLHDRFHGNDMALMNLAAHAACPAQPFKRAPMIYNSRPFYRRAPHLLPNRLAGHDAEGRPMLVGPFGPIRILHFIGRAKPWSAHVDNEDSVKTWRYYRARAKREIKL